MLVQRTASALTAGSLAVMNLARWAWITASSLRVVPDIRAQSWIQVELTFRRRKEELQAVPLANLQDARDVRLA